MQIKKKAFTLTELLVVVMVIGILSAIVLPKFGKVLETRKTTEAESIMSAIRTEQEKRCALERPYAGQWAQLTDIVPSSESKHFQYALTSTGVTAGSKSSAYTLEMPSYADGRICCSGSKCAELNKDYPGCSDSTFVASLTASPSDCGATDTDEPTPCSNLPTNLTQTEQCGCNNGGTKTNTFNTTTCQWEYGTCSIADACECTGTKPTGSKACTPQGQTTECGTQAAIYECNTATGEYELVGYNETCQPTSECSNCDPQDRDTCQRTEGAVWHDDICSCQCPEGYKEGQGGECIPVPCAGYEQDRDTCLRTEGATWHDDICMCQCPPEYDLGQGGECLPRCQRTDENLNKAQNCEQGDQSNVWQAGVWSWSECKCNCPQGTVQTANGSCKESYCRAGVDYAQDRDACEKNYTISSDHVKGYWEAERCMCHCLKGSHYGEQHHYYCVLNSGKSEDDLDYDCIASPDGCGYWNDAYEEDWDNYPDYDDDRYDDRDDDRDDGWDGW